MCSPEGKKMQLQPVWNCSRMTGTIQASHPLKCSQFAGRYKETSWLFTGVSGKMSSQQQESSFPLQKQHTMPFCSSPPGAHHARRVLVSKDNVGILSSPASVPATSPMKINVWGDLAGLKTLKKDRSWRGGTLGLLHWLWRPVQVSKVGFRVVNCVS